MHALVLIHNVFRAEALKLKRTLALWLALLAPLVVAALETLAMLANGEEMAPLADGEIWLWNTKFMLTLWGLLVLPLFVSLETALQAGLEHSAQAWKQLYVQPMPRWMTLAAKQLSGLVLIGLSQLNLWGLALLSGWLLRYLRPNMGFNTPAPWFEMLSYSLLVYGMAWLLIAAHSWVALRWSSFVAAMGFGVVATLSGVFFINSDYAPYYPWAMPGLAANKLLESGIPWEQVAMGVLGGLLLFVVGNLELARREVL